jgi:hypothetical protein
MPYMQRLTNDGISLHASEVEWGYASHGCIGMPESFAAKVFAQTKLGDKVYITRGKTIGMGIRWWINRALAPCARALARNSSLPARAGRRVRQSRPDCWSAAYHRAGQRHRRAARCHRVR